MTHDMMTPTSVSSEAPLLLSIWEQPGAIVPSPSNSIAAAGDDAGHQHAGTPSPRPFNALGVVQWFGLVMASDSGHPIQGQGLKLPQNIQPICSW